MSLLERFRLDDKVAVVTGAGKGIGAAIALAFADAGADVALLARTASDLEGVASEVEKRGRRALVVPTDVIELPQLSSAVETTIAELDGIDIVVNNAGGAVPAPFMDTRAEHMEWAFHFNVTSPIELSRLAVPHLLAHLLDDVVLPFEEPEPAAPVCQVVHVIRKGLHEAVHLVDELRHEARADADDHDQHDHVRDADRETATEAGAPLDPADERVEREREEECDHDPRQHVARDPHDLERDPDTQHDQDHAEDRAGGEVDHALGRHGASIASRSDVVTVRR